MFSISELLRRGFSTKKVVPVETQRQTDSVVAIIKDIPEAIEVRGFGSAFDGSGRWNPTRRGKPSDIDLVVIFDNQPNWSCFTNGEEKIPYIDEEGDISRYPTETEQRSKLRKRIKEVAPLASLFMMTREDITEIIRGKTGDSEGYSVFGGATDPRRMVLNIKRTKLLWRSR